ncbi:phosphoglycerate mutase family protein KNAG_0A06260 [Huiozyma naganishii CBS 8797]|uniref:Phosphoglycerate mutase n=1 Tax=Huiozyma naganishii (strain ATCC MYA-139 / BCRC 22969 / CBS 8797 / KCTC 17520 / NBRC 10181 / NCYC 3082 / Yp74L-3) TaxID=1071383 RepID=J7RU07_HUIN7|nr:hypothetical protein KNAG_0A06260 [Kazachstania naganishii CBS 8797]CCK68287.1 hypothetical protein KNAG_0A06260 [Kazachstania naganishii CBS 8797]
MTIFESRLEFKALPGFFSGYATEDSGEIDARYHDHLGLINHRNWKELYKSIPRDTESHQYKLIILARHGQGYHNAAIARYGRESWNSKWCYLNGDEHGEWLDSKLTPVGQEEVKNTGLSTLLPMVDSLQILPHKCFSSPMRRCLETFTSSWTHVFQEHKELLPENNTVNVKIFENLREDLNTHPCNERVDHSVSVSEYQDCKMKSGTSVHWEYEPDYPEKDQLWSPTQAESKEELDKRIHDGLTQVFETVSPTDKFISITCHSRVIESSLRNLKHPMIWWLGTAQVVCAVVEITKR